MVRNRREVSVPESGAVGSSMIISRASNASARAISTSCCSAIPNSPAGRDRVEIVTQRRQQSAGALMDLVPSHQAAAPGVPAEENILADTQLWDDGEFLMHETDPQIPAFPGVFQVDGFAVPQNGAAIPLQHAADDVDQGGFARAVGPGQRMHFARAHVERNVAKDGDTAETLADVFNSQHGSLS